MALSSTDLPGRAAAAITSGACALLRQPSVHYGAHAEDVVVQLAKDRGATRILPIVTSSLLGQPAVVAAIFGRPGESAANAVRRFIESLGLPTRLSQLGVDESALPRVAETGLDNAFVKANLRPIETAADVMRILHTAW